MKEKFTLKARDHLGSSEGKRLFNEKHFAESAPRYDIATRALSFGQDAGWKRALVAGLSPVEGSTPRCVDIACGTGDIALQIAERFPDAEILGIDLTPEMIELAKARNHKTRVSFTTGDMSHLPLEDDSVDILTGGYAIRNAPDLGETLTEFARVLKPGAQAVFLDFSKPNSSAMQTLQFGMLKTWGSLWGLLLHGNPEVHGYISSSLRSFPDRESLVALYQSHGFRLEETKPLLTGMMRLDFLRYEPAN